MFWNMAGITTFWGCIAMFCGVLHAHLEKSLVCSPRRSFLDFFKHIKPKIGSALLQKERQLWRCKMHPHPEQSLACSPRKIFFGFFQAHQTMKKLINIVKMESQHWKIIKITKWAVHCRKRSVDLGGATNASTSEKSLARSPRRSFLDFFQAQKEHRPWQCKMDPHLEKSLACSPQKIFSEFFTSTLGLVLSCHAHHALTTG